MQNYNQHGINSGVTNCSCSSCGCFIILVLITILGIATFIKMAVKFFTWLWGF